MPTDTYLRVGLVGAGYISEFHARAIQRVPNARIIGIADVVNSRASALAARFSIPKVFHSMEAMIKEGVDVIHILTPPDTHAQLAIAALKNGCHVLVEKPLAINAEEVDRISDAAEATKKSLCVNHSMLYDRFVSKALSLVRSGAIGVPLSFDYFRSSEYPPYRGGPLPVHYQDGGYPFLDQGVHALYLAESFLGAIEDVKSFYGAHGGDSNLLFDEWRVAAQCQRGTANIQISWNVRPLQNWFVVQGTKGVIRANLFAMWVTHTPHLPLPKAPARALQAMTEGLSICAQVPANVARFALKKIVQYDGLHSLVAVFYNALQTGAPMPVPVEQARSTVYWTNRVSQEADVAKITFQSQFKSAGNANVLVTGANGLIGRHVVRRLLLEGNRVRIFVRRQPLAEFLHDGNIEVFLGDLGDPAAVDRAVAGTEIVYHVGAAMQGGAHDHQRGTVCGTQNIVDSMLRHHVSRLVYISSLSCLHAAVARRGDVVTEDWPVEPYPTKRGAYTQAKTAAEKIVLDAVRDRHLQAVLLRPGRVFGPGMTLLTPEVARRLGNLFVILGDGTRELPLVYVEDVIDAAVLAAETSKFDGRIFHIVDRTKITQNQVVLDYVSKNAKKSSVIHVPVAIVYCLALGFELLSKVLNRSVPLSIYRVKSALARMRFDCSRAENELGWHPRIGVASGLQETMAAERVSSSNNVLGRVQESCAAK
ncbi:MAG TPA: NAD-dependent epimerase/dehydratase family protein [Candidatus Acidoferrum sp.]|nr:NAD-dependent epimerase/dehydratase family protein [Candidatus Acidoferrum sp.]